VEVLHGALVDVRGLHLDARVEGLVDGLARRDVLELGPHEGRALAGLDVLELHDGPELAVDLEDHAVLEVVRRCHEWWIAFYRLAGRPRSWSVPGTAHP